MHPYVPANDSQNIKNIYASQKKDKFCHTVVVTHVMKHLVAHLSFVKSISRTSEIYIGFVAEDRRCEGEVFTPREKFKD